MTAHPPPLPPSLPADALDQEISKLESRVAELRQAAVLPDVDPRAALDAALVELDLALAALRAVSDPQTSAPPRQQTADLERRTLQTIFREAPVPVFVLERDGRIRRINRRASTLIGTSAGYAAGKPFPVFCDIPERATLRSQLAGVVRTGRRRQVAISFLGKGQDKATLILARAWTRGEPEPLVIAVATSDPPQQTAHAAGTPRAGRQVPRAAGETDDDVIAALVRRMDLLSTATELLLDDRSFTESVALRRCARLLGSELAEWVLVDMPDGDDTLTRQIVLGPPDEQSGAVASRLEDLQSGPGTLPAEVYERGRSALVPHVDELGLLGATPGNEPVCALIHATSVLAVPINDGERTYGVMTLTATGEQTPLDFVDLGLVERIAHQLALVIRADREYRHRAEVARALQDSLLPRELPRIPGLDLSAKYLVAVAGIEVGGDFYDAFTTPSGWGLALGDVCGKGQEAATVTATARHGIRLLARWTSSPAEVLSKVNESILVDHELGAVGPRFVTAVMACLEWRDQALRVVLGSAGHPPAVVIRRDGGIRILAGGGIPLGLFDDFEPGVETIDLTPGDTLVLHSDGVTDVCDREGERFGDERLIELLASHAADPVADITGLVERNLLDFCDGDLRDDVSLLAMRVTEIPEV